MQPSDPQQKLNHSWVENELDKINSASQMKYQGKTYKPNLQENPTNLSLSISLGKTQSTYPHLPLKINPKELSNKELEDILRTGKVAERVDSPVENPATIPQTNNSSFKPLSMYNTQEPESLKQSIIQKSIANETLPNPKAADIMAKYATPSKPIISSVSTLQYSASKAYTSAMKALQDKVRTLERENEHLAIKLKTTEKTLDDEQSKLHSRVSEEMSHWTEIEKKMQNDLKNYEAENLALRRELSELKESKELLAREKLLVEKEKDRHIEQNSTDREQWRKEKNSLVGQISEGNEKIQQLVKQKEIMLDEIEETKSKLGEISGLFDKSRIELETELKRTKQEADSVKEKLKTIKKKHDQEISGIKNELENAYKEIERLKQKAKEESIKERNDRASLKRTIDNQKKEIEVLRCSRQSKLQQKTPVAIKQQNVTITSQIQKSGSKKPGEHKRNVSKGVTERQKSNKKNTKSRSSSKDKNPRSRSRSKGKLGSINASREFATVHEPEKEEITMQFKEKANKTIAPIEVVSYANPDSISQLSEYTMTNKTKGGLDEISNEIFFLERDIADLNRQYKEMLTKSNDPGSEKIASNIRIDLNHIARLLEEKSERLFELRKQQQLALKST